MELKVEAHLILFTLHKMLDHIKMQFPIIHPGKTQTLFLRSCWYQILLNRCQLGWVLDHPVQGWINAHQFSFETVDIFFQTGNIPGQDLIQNLSLSFQDADQMNFVAFMVGHRCTGERLAFLWEHLLRMLTLGLVQDHAGRYPLQSPRNLTPVTSTTSHGWSSLG